jgi:Protein of unknown function (DUF2798)
MPKLPNRYSPFIFGAIQSGLTCAVAAAIAIAPRWHEASAFTQWLQSWLIAWGVMLPVVLLAAPAISRVTAKLTDQRAQ